MGRETEMNNDKGVRVAGIVAMVIGLLMVVAGGVTWGLVSSQLAAENITVADDAAAFAGKQVNGPLDAYFQADIINHHALEATGGKTYAELDREDPLRAVAMNGSFLRASLFTSVVAFGVAAFAMGVGVLTILFGWAVSALSSAKVSASAVGASA
ncbi:MAG TPA: aromatic ring-opening dioxygenase LigA [Actinotalea sp.]|nr:aromatic ring-opening dioxygenase LigA [Actinotalea sp.]